MANCKNCSAPLGASSIVCSYCGSRNDIDLKEINYYTLNESAEPRICPRCGINLKTVDLNIESRFLVERCEECLGFFFDTGELEALLKKSVSDVYAVNMKQLNLLAMERKSAFGVSYVKCPVCSKIMNREGYGAKSGVVASRCKDHGIWLDGGELRALFEWYKAGGELLEKRREEERRKEEENRLKEMRRELQMTTPEERAVDRELFGEKNDSLDMASLLMKAAKLLFR